MTTEIAIMNKTAIALAADSAATVLSENHIGTTQKIFNTANKLFTLSKYAPVGIMIYGASSLMSIPWETIIKQYRKNLGNKKFKRLSDYCDSFFRYLDDFNFEKVLQERYIQQLSFSIASQIKNELDEIIKAKIPKASTEDVDLELPKIINRQHKIFEKLLKDCNFDTNERDKIKSKFKDLIDKPINHVFGKISIKKDLLDKIRDSVIIASGLCPSNQSGIVIAGFGEDDIYPACANYDVAAVFQGKTIKRFNKKNIIDHNSSAAIIPFAQSEDVHTFMQGVSKPIDDFFKEIFAIVMNEQIPKDIVDYLENELSINSLQKKKVLKDMKNLGKGVFDYISNKLDEIKKDRYIKPVTNATAFLNKEELAVMAETLVNLVSFRKQVTMESETVGGPIDVAVITKGDGFIWIKRKHYFEPKLNHQFFNNYFSVESENGNKKEKNI